MNRNFKINSNAQGGFTLIELIVVIVILGILAATALPKFADLGGDARAASVQAAKGSIASASAMIHGKYLVATTNPSSVNIEGTTVTTVNGYPAATTTSALDIAAGLSSNDYTVTYAGTAPAVMTVSPKSAKTVATCKVTYTEATASAATPPVITVPAFVVTTTDCS